MLSLGVSTDYKSFGYTGLENLGHHPTSSISNTLDDAIDGSESGSYSVFNLNTGQISTLSSFDGYHLMS